MREQVGPANATRRKANAGLVGTRGSARQHVLALQRTFGNSVTARLLQRAPQRKSQRSRLWVDDEIPGIEFEGGARNGDWRTFKIRGSDRTVEYNHRTGSYHEGVDKKRIEASSLRPAPLQPPVPDAPPSASPSASPVSAQETKEIISWLSSSSGAPSEYDRGYLPDRVYHVLAKGELLDEACIEWALRGLAKTPIDPDAFFQWLTGSGTVEPAWVDRLAGDVAQELRKMLGNVRKGCMNELFAKPVPARKLPMAKQYVRRACDILVSQCGFEIVGEANAQGWVCCQWQIAAGMVRPQHWWIELRTVRGPLVLQTVTGKNIEVGLTNLRWHNASSAIGRDDDVALYETYRIPVRAVLLLSHLTFLRQAMRAALEPPPRQRRGRDKVEKERQGE